MKKLIYLIIWIQLINSIKFIMDINELDSKFSLDFLSKTKPNTCTNSDLTISAYPGTNGLVWICEDFLSKAQCEEIIANSEKAGFEYLEYRNSSRLIGFDSNSVLTDLIVNNFNSEYLTQRLNKKPSTPYGFYSNYIQWNPIEPYINKCIRINRYSQSQEFKFHRDAQYTQSHLVKSSHSILIYLNDGFDGGETVFRFPKKQYVNPGLTIKQELELIGSDYTDIVIKPRQGQMIIFDQRLLHAGQIVKSGTKYVLRTDLVRTGFVDTDEPIEKLGTELENKIYALAQGIFRQAQLTELNKLNKINTSELYEICIGLRQTPHLITEYPANLEALLTNLLPKPQPISKFLKLIERNGLEFKYNYTLDANKLDLLKIAYITSVYMSTSDLTHYPSFIEKVSKLYSTFGLESIIKAEPKELVDNDTKLPYIILLEQQNDIQQWTEKIFSSGKYQKIKHHVLNKISSYVYHKIREYFGNVKPSIKLINKIYNGTIEKSWYAFAFVGGQWEDITPTLQQILDCIDKNKHVYIDEIHKAKSHTDIELNSDAEESDDEVDEDSDDESDDNFAGIPKTYEDLNNKLKESDYWSRTRLSNQHKMCFFPQIAKYFNTNLGEPSFTPKLKKSIEPFDLLCSVQAQNYGFNCQGCCLCDHTCFNNQNDDTAFYGGEIDIEWDHNFLMKILNLKINRKTNEMSGQMQIETTATSFNHASCQCDRYVDYGDSETIYAQVKLGSDFTFDQNKQILVIKLIPKIIM